MLFTNQIFMRKVWEDNVLILCTLECFVVLSEGIYHLVIPGVACISSMCICHTILSFKICIMFLFCVCRKRPTLMYMYYINTNFHAISLGKNYANTYSVLFCNNKREGDLRTNHQRKWTPIVWSVSLDIVLFYTSIRNYTHTHTSTH